MQNQDMERLTNHAGAPEDTFQAIKRDEELTNLLERWPVLADASARVMTSTERGLATTDGASR